MGKRPQMAVKGVFTYSLSYNLKKNCSVIHVVIVIVIHTKVSPMIQTAFWDIPKKRPNFFFKWLYKGEKPLGCVRHNLTVSLY